MKNKSVSILGPVKRIISIIVIAIILILACFIYLLYQNRHREYEDKLLINVFGKQRMYTQMISKDASRMYSLMQALEVNEEYQSEEDVFHKIAEIKVSLSRVREDFRTTLEAIHNKQMDIATYVIYIDSFDSNTLGYLRDIDAIWVNFESSIEVLLQAEKIDSSMAEAAIYINENNMVLLNLCDDLLEQILENTINEDKTTQYLSFGLIGLLLIIIIVAFIELQRFLIQPFSKLYKGIAEIGLDNYPANPHFPTKNKVMPIVSEIGDMFRKINHLITLIENMNNNNSFHETLQFINKTFSTFIPYNYIGIALIDEEQKILKASYGVSDGTIVGMPENIVGATWPVSDTSMEELLKTGEARIINDIEEYCMGKPMKPYNSIILEAGIRASITLPLKVSGEPVGMIFFSSASKNVYNEKHLKFLRTLANSIAVSLNQNIFVSDILFSSILALAKLAEARDEDTGEHMDRMSIYSRVIAELLYENNVYRDQITMDYIEKIERFSPLHDIGKVGIIDGILLKPGKLTSEEFNEMKKHTDFGAEVLRSAERNMKKKGRSLFTMGIEIAEGHHERWDGTGYPYGRKGTEIPLSARIVAVADVFDALTSKRPYKEAYSFELSMDIIAGGRGKHFDPKIVDIFLANRKQIERLYHATVLLRSNESDQKVG